MYYRYKLDKPWRVPSDSYELPTKHDGNLPVHQGDYDLNGHAIMFSECGYWLFVGEYVEGQDMVMPEVPHVESKEQE